MNNHWKSNFPNISTDDLIALAKDAEQRIGSHVAGGNPLPDYVQNQKDLLSLIKEELEKRG